MWSSNYINKLEDASFLYIEQGGEVDETGRTKPRSLRHLPVYDADGLLDLPHLRNAIARIPQASSDWLSEADKKRLQEKARRMLSEATKSAYARSKGLPDWALEYAAHTDDLEAAGISGDAVYKAWKGDSMVGKRAADLLRSLTHQSKERVSKRVTRAIEKVLRAKVAVHNTATPPPKFRVRVGQVKTAYQRGVAAYMKSRRPSVKSAAQWGFARVEAALAYCKSGILHHPGYTEDFDYLPKSIAKDEMGAGDLAAGGRLSPSQNYRSVTFAGLPVVIDRPKGFVQRKTDAKGNLLWEREYKNDYGYIPSTLGGDSEELDVYLAGDETAPSAFWIVQVDDEGEFDEYKVVLGAKDEAEARGIYLAHTPEKYLDRVFETPVSVLHSLLGLEPEDLLKAVEPTYYFAATDAGALCTAHPWTTLAMSGPTGDDDADAASAPTRPLTLSTAQHREMVAALAAVEKLLPPPRSKIVTPLAPGAGAAPLNDETLVMLSAPDPFAVDIDAVLTLAEDAPVALVEMPETPKNVGMLGKLGGVFRVNGVPGRIWVATYPLPGAAQQFITPLDPEMVTFAVEEGKAENDPKTPADPDERVRGSDTNEEGSASSGSGDIALDNATEAALERKVEEHNASVDDPAKKATLGALKAVWRRGAGAFSTSHRPQGPEGAPMTRSRWAMGRVNAFLKLLKSGKPDNPKYTTDNDLLPADHPRSTKKAAPDTGEVTHEAATSDELFLALHDGAVAAADKAAATDVVQADMTPEAKQKRIDEAYAKYHDTVNMSASELEAWSKTECSKLASLDRSPIERNLRLLRKKKEDWDLDDARDANRTVNFVSRMKGAEQGEPAREGCDSKRDISLKNWAYNPGKKSASLDDLQKEWEEEIQGAYDGEEEPVDKDAVRGEGGKFAGSDGNNDQHPTHTNQLGKFGEKGTSARDNRLQWAGMKAKEIGKPAYAIRDKKTDPAISGGFKLSYSKPKKGEHYEIHPDGRIAHFKSVTPPDAAAKVEGTPDIPPPVPAPGAVSVEANPVTPPLPSQSDVGKAVAGEIVQFGKAEDERYTFGIVLVPDEPDLQGDVYDAATIRRAADIYMTKFQNIALQHNVKPGEIDAFHDENPNLYNGKIVIVDSIVFPTDTVIAGKTVKAGTWCLGHRWVDDDLWAAVKSGKYTGLSMGGFARRVALDAASSPAA